MAQELFTGTWSGTYTFGPMSAVLQQTGSVVSGQITDAAGCLWGVSGSGSGSQLSLPSWALLSNPAPSVCIGATVTMSGTLASSHTTITGTGTTVLARRVHIPWTFTLTLTTPTSCRVAVPSWKQIAPAEWHDDDYDHIPYKMSRKGCGITSLAMVAHFAGYDTDPGRLNETFRDDVDYQNRQYGYAKDGSVMWPHIASVSGGKLSITNRLPFDLETIRQELCANHPVIVRVTRNGGPHYVVAKGFEDGEYLIEDPGTNAQDTKLSDYGNAGTGLHKVILASPDTEVLHTADASELRQFRVTRR